MSRIKLGESGFVYLMTSISLPGMIKIGAATDNPTIRAKQLTASTSSPTPFHVVYQKFVADVNAVETAMHNAFAGYRVNESREFFRVSVYEAARTLDALCGEFSSKLDPPTPFAELFSTFAENDSNELTEDEIRACTRLREEMRLSDR